MKIIEFTGVPGAGKSTICDLLEEALHDKGFRVLNLHIFELNENLCKKVTRKYKEERAKRSRINRDFIRNISSLQLSSQVEIDEWIQIIEVMNYRIHTESEKYDFILMDEGIIQAITALYHGILIDDDKAIGNLLNTFCTRYLSSTIIINLNVNPDTICERLKKRNREGDLFLEGNDEMIKSLLAQKWMNIEFLLGVSDFPTYNLDANTSSEEVTNDILHILL